jgi:hypothetical protein
MKIAGGDTVAFKLAGTHGIPANADEALLDVTVTSTKAAGYAIAGTSNEYDFGMHDADWAAGKPATGLAFAFFRTEDRAGAVSKVELTNESKGSAVFTVDLVGYYNFFGNGSVLLPTSPSRVLDVKIAAKHTAKLAVAGKLGLPASGISAADVNLTASSAATNGKLVVWPDEATRPSDASLTYSAGNVTAVSDVVPVGADGGIDLYNAGASTVTVTVDLDGGYYRYP